MDQNLTAIERLLTEFGRCADRGDGDQLSLLFLPSGVLTVNSKMAEGRTAIAKFTNERTADPERTTRHVWSNLLVERSDVSGVVASVIQMTYEQKGNGPGTVRVNDVADAFARDSDGSWRFASRTITRQITVGA